jgi:hypothetical protein
MSKANSSITIGGELHTMLGRQLWDEDIFDTIDQDEVPDAMATTTNA